MAYHWYVKQSVIDVLKANGAIGLERIYIECTDDNYPASSGDPSYTFTNLSTNSYIQFGGGNKIYFATGTNYNVGYGTDTGHETELTLTGNGIFAMQNGSDAAFMINTLSNTVFVAYKRPDLSGSVPLVMASVSPELISAYFTDSQGGAANSLPTHGKWKVIPSIISALITGGSAPYNTLTGLQEIQIETSDGNPPAAQMFVTTSGDLSGTWNESNVKYELTLTSGTWPRWVNQSGKTIKILSADGLIEETLTVWGVDETGKILSVDENASSLNGVWSQSAYVSSGMTYNLIHGAGGGSGSYIKVSDVEYPLEIGSINKPVSDSSGLTLLSGGSLVLADLLSSNAFIIQSSGNIIGAANGQTLLGLAAGALPVDKKFTGANLLGGGAPEPTNLVPVDGKVVGEVTVDPTVTEVLYDDDNNPETPSVALPTGSILRNTSNTQKFIKITGNSKAYLSIPVSPDVDWGWTGGATAWSTLQDK